MKTKVLIAHAKGEDGLAEQLAGPIRAAGYEVAHEGTVLVGDSVVNEASKLLAEGLPVVMCGTVRAVGTKWARQVVNAARRHAGVRIFIVQMEEEADVEMVSFDEAVAHHWQDSAKAEQDLIAALKKYYPPERDPGQNLRVQDLESRYRDLALKSCEIIDLDILGGDDRHLAQRELEVRRLYVGLRMRLEVQAGDEPDEQTLEALERRRAVAWGGGRREATEDQGLVSLGERLQAARPLVVLGDPGAGKSTLLRWLATAYLLKNDQDWRELPDIASLPEANWLPILIRCRDLPPGTENLEDMLRHSLRKAELSEAECTELVDLLRGKLKDGAALLLVDGLDEITEPSARARFSQQLERIHRAFEQAPMVVTSRIVGYREMGYRLRAGFEHLTVAEFSREDKDDFARRWCQLTERPERREDAAAELIHDIHSSDRIERLTGNPMLLATMALVKRKVGVLPQRRAELYQEAVKVLLNWRSVVDAPLDTREALPQLEYLAHAMCEVGVQQLREDQAVELLRQMRQDYLHIHPLSQHSPEDFLALLERRTGLLIQSGHTRHNGQSVPVYEFRHLTFQEYLAGLALVQGYYRGWDKNKSLAEVVAPLAGLVEERRFIIRETAVVENWREALRLCVAICNPGDEDTLIQAILNPLSDETGTERPRAVMAALCLADDPNVSEPVALQVLRTMAEQMGENDGGGSINTSLTAAAMELAASRWTEPLGECLLDKFFQRDADKYLEPGGLYAMVQEQRIMVNERGFSTWLAQAARKLSECSEREAAGMALTLMQLAFRRKNCQAPGIVEGLLQWLSASTATSDAAAWALFWMNDGRFKDCAWHPDSRQIEILLFAVGNPACESGTLRFLSKIFKEERTAQAVKPLLLHLPQSPIGTQIAILEALGNIGDESCLAALTAGLQDPDERLRKAALGGLAQTCEDETDRRLLFRDFNDLSPRLDPQSPITPERIAEAAQRLNKPPEEIRQRYTALAERFGLRLAW